MYIGSTRYTRNTHGLAGYSIHIRSACYCIIPLAFHTEIVNILFRILTTYSAAWEGVPIFFLFFLFKAFSARIKHGRHRPKKKIPICRISEQLPSPCVVIMIGIFGNKQLLSFFIGIRTTKTRPTDWFVFGVSCLPEPRA